jgi:hypothetical protein
MLLVLDIMKNNNCGQMQQMRVQTFTHKLDLNTIKYCILLSVK